MGDIEELNNEINQALDALESNLQTISKKDYSQRPKVIKRCENQAADIATRIESYELEILYLDKSKAAPYKESLKQIQERLGKVREELEFKKKERETEGTLIGEIMKRRGPDEGLSGNEMIQIGNALQKKGTESLQRTLEKVNASNQIADEIALELHRQLEQIENSTKTVADTRSDVKKANEYIRYFAKELYTDKFIMCLMILCLIAILVIIVLKIVNGNSSDSSSNDTLPNSAISQYLRPSGDSSNAHISSIEQ